MAILLVPGLAASTLGGPTLALEGGGFRAQSAGTGFVAGMLAFLGKPRCGVGISDRWYGHRGRELRSTYVASSAEATDEWCESQCAAYGCAEDAQKLCECSTTHPAQQPDLTPTAQQPHPTPTLESTGLLGRFAAFSSNSGSSWFLSELVYSPRFKALVEQMAAAPATSAAAYHSAWTSRWLEATDVQPRKFKLFAEAARALVRALFGTGDEDTVYLLQFFLAAGHASWDDFVDILLNSTSGLLPTARLGGPLSGAWAAGKVWLVDHSLVTPSSEPARIYQAKSVYPQVSYRARAGPMPTATPDDAMPNATLPRYTPAAYSVTLGGGLQSERPFRYVAPSALGQLRALDYLGVNLPLVDVHRSAWVRASSQEAWAAAARAPSSEGPIAEGEAGEGHGEGRGEGRGGLFDRRSRRAGMLPVSRVAAASSAFLGGAAVAGWVAAEGMALADGLDLVPWSSIADAGRSFDQAKLLVARLRHDTGQQAIDALAAAAVHGVVDGAYTEGTGVATAVAAGASEVVVLLNSIRSASAAVEGDSLVRLFRGAPPPHTQTDAPYLTQVFEAPLAPAVLRRLQAFRRLHIPTGSQYLSEIALGTITARTATNPYYGIPSGRSVQVHVVSVGSSLDIGEFENLAHYDRLAQEIATALIAPANAALVGSTLLPMFLPATATAHATATTAPATATGNT